MSQITRTAMLAAVAVVTAGVLGSSAHAETLIVNLDPYGGQGSAGYAINGSGQVAGSVTYAGKPHAFRYNRTNDAKAELGALPGGWYSEGYAINASGQVAGDGENSAGYAHAFRYSGTPGVDGTMADLGSLGGPNSFGRGINASGQVAGYSELPSYQIHAFLYSGTPGVNGAMADLGTLPGGSYSYGRALNASGQVAGESWTAGDSVYHAFLYSGTPGVDGAMADLGTLGGTSSVGTAVNALGQVAGYSFTTDDAAQHPFLYSGTPGVDGTMADLGSLGGRFSGGRAINAAGQVVGYSETSAGQSHAFLYIGTAGVDGQMIDLDAWLDANDPVAGAKWNLREAWGISDSGLITGFGDYFDGAGALDDGRRAFLLDVSALVPEPASLSLLAMSGLTLLRRRRRAGR